MKTGIHPELKPTKVSCLGCGNTFDSTSTVKEINVDVCSNCHPFYTGKQKLVDTAGRVDRFRAQTKQAETRVDDRAKKAQKAAKRAAERVENSKTAPVKPVKTPKAAKTAKPTPVASPEAEEAETTEQ